MKRIRQSVIFLCLGGWLFLGQLARADLLPQGKYYQITSSNGFFFSLITPNDSISTHAALEPTGMLWVYTRDSSLMWQQPIIVGKTPVGLLSDDGASFYYVEQHYTFHVPVVVIYRQDQEPISVTGKQFRLPRFQESLTDALWLGEPPFLYVDEWSSKLILYTKDSQPWSIDVETEQVDSFTENQNYFVLIFLLVGGIAIIIAIKVGVNNLLATPKL